VDDENILTICLVKSSEKLWRIFNKTISKLNYKLQLKHSVLQVKTTPVSNMRTFLIEQNIGFIKLQKHLFETMAFTMKRICKF